MQLSQLMGVAALGTVFLTFRHGALHQADHVSATAMSTTAYWLALVSLIGVAAAAMLARSVLLDRPPAPYQGMTILDQHQ
jgi:hypothetical protein